MSVSGTTSTSSNPALPPIQLTGLTSGIDTASLIQALLSTDKQHITDMQNKITTYQTQESVYSQIQSEVQSLYSAVQALSPTSIIDTNPFNAKIATSSNSGLVTASVDSTASAQTISVEVDALATSTTANSLSAVGQWMTNASNISDVARQTVTNGSFTVFVDGTANSINVDTSQNVNSVLTQINALGLTATVNATGQLVVQKNGHAVSLGGSGDTSNFLVATNLQTGTDSGAAITASAGVSTINLGVAVSGAGANLSTPVTDGTFTIGGATFDTTGKSLSQIVSDINNNSAAGVTASYNAVTNKLQLSAKTAGSALISMSDGSGNFLTAMGLISGGNSTTSQTAGTNATLKVNGNTIYSPSNTVTPAITGLTGVTLNLTGSAVGSTSTITVSNDLNSLETDIQSFIDAYNKVVSDIDTQTNAQNGGPLAGQTTLVRFRQQLRSMVSSAVSGLSGSAYDSLMQVGISTGAVTGTAVSATPTLVFDKSKFEAAMAGNPDQVKLLFSGKDLTGADDGTAGDDNVNGIMTQLSALLTDQKTETSTGSGVFTYGALYSSGGSSENGLFAAFKTSADNRITSLNQSITDAQTRLTQKQTMLQQQFTAMENAMQQFQSQGSALTNLTNQLAANSKSG